MNLPPVFIQQYFDSNGDPLAGGKLYTYQAGTTTPQATYTDQGGGTPCANPIVLDANGRCEMWLDPELSYKFVLKDSSDVTIDTIDNVVGLLTADAVSTATIQNLAVTTAKLADDSVTADKLKDDASTDANRAVTTNHIRNEAVTLPKLAATVAASLAPVGSILAYAGTSAPTGFLMCDGSAVSRATYSALFSAIGTAHGSGDGSTTFKIPDYRGRFLRMVDGAAGNDPDRSSRTAMNSGGNTGDNVGSVQSDQYAIHQHGLTVYGGAAANSPTAYQPTWTNSTVGSYTGGLTANAGGNETRPKNANVNFIIKY